ncbi:MAG: energy transducer TonB [Burkholderiaceae bacterium]
MLAGAAAWAQPAPQSSAAASAAERAQKESDRTMYWIRVLADKPAPVKVATAPKPAAAAAVPSARPAQEAREKVKVAAAPSPTATSTSTTAIAANVEPAPAPVADAPEPTALSSSHADSVAAAAAAVPHPDFAPTPAAESDPGLIQIASVQPDFPATVVRRIHKGNVEVQFEVAPGGTVVEAAVVESSHPRLNEAAVEAVKQWRFKPTPKTHTAVVNLVFDIDKEHG